MAIPCLPPLYKNQLQQGQYQDAMISSQPMAAEFDFDLNLEPHERPSLEQDPAETPDSDIFIHRQHMMCCSLRGAHDRNEDQFDIIVKDGFVLAGLYDGHGGPTVSLYLKQSLLASIAAHALFQARPDLAIRQCIEDIEKQVTEKFQSTCGSTLLIVLWTKNYLYVANVGDSLCFGFQNTLGAATSDTGARPGKETPGNEYQRVELNCRHNLESEGERARVRKRGGSILRASNCYRVAGELSLSRSIGDKKYKKWISACPDIRVFSNDFEYVLLASDGLSRVLAKMSSPHKVEHLACNMPSCKDDSTFILLSRPPAPV